VIVEDDGAPIFAIVIVDPLFPFDIRIFSSDALERREGLESNDFE
jgi:hypothetical protein